MSGSHFQATSFAGGWVTVIDGGEGMPYAEFQTLMAKAATLDVSQKIELITFLVQSLSQVTNKETSVITDSVLSLKGIFKDPEVR